MTDQEINATIAEYVGHDLWVIVKRGLYYRPNAHGYTYSIEDAWKLPKDEAKKHEAYVDRDDVPFNEKVFIESAPTLNYCNSKDAMQPCLEGLPDHLVPVYQHNLCKVRNEKCKQVCRCFAATAREQAEAFLMTVGKL